MDAAVGFFEVPVLRYVGAKWKLADWVLSFFPVHRTYVEPYAGSAAIFFRKHPSEVETLEEKLACVIREIAGEVVRDALFSRGLW